MSSAKIASIYFAPVHGDRSIYGGIYDLPAVALGAEPAILVVEDKVQRDEGPYSLGNNGRRVQNIWPVWADDICRDLVREWTAGGLGMTHDSHPGIWIVREKIAITKTDKDGTEQPVFDVMGSQIFRPATAEEASAMWEQDLAHNKVADKAYADWCFMEGNRIAADPRNIQFISKNYKRAAKQYGLAADWLKEGAATAVMPCPLCTKVIPKHSTVCQFCTGVVNVQAYALHQAQKDNALRLAKKGIVETERDLAVA